MNSFFDFLTGADSFFWGYIAFMLIILFGLLPYSSGALFSNPCVSLYCEDVF